MLYLSRKLGESIIINDGIEVQVVEIKKSHVKLGISSSVSTRVLRKEVFEKVQQENILAGENLHIVQQIIDEDQ